MRIVSAELYLLPVTTRVPLKFGTETLTEVTCARVKIEACGEGGRRAIGWGETPLSVQWVWPSAVPYAVRFARMLNFCRRVARQYVQCKLNGHALEIGRDFQDLILPGMMAEFNRERTEIEPMPWLAALLCFSAFDIAAHDAFGQLVGLPAFKTFGRQHLKRDLADLIEDAPAFRSKFPADFLANPRREQLVAWHLVGGLDPLEPADVTGPSPGDDYPVHLRDWIAVDGLQCLKIKLRGNDADWDCGRIVRVGAVAREAGVDWLSVDFNCTVKDPQYVIDILDRVKRDHPETDRMILYVEQPFPYELEVDRNDVRGVASRKPLFLDESAHDWRHVRLGRELGWTGVALKTCKTLSGALLGMCWARSHGMSLMVQDLTNPMLAQISHASLAANVQTIMGVETNAMQFYPDASGFEARVHPGLFRRRGGRIDLSTITGPGIGYQIDQIGRPLPPAFHSEG